MDTPFPHEVFSLVAIVKCKSGLRVGLNIRGAAFGAFNLAVGFVFFRDGTIHLVISHNPPLQSQ